MTEFMWIIKPLLVILLHLSESHQVRYMFVAEAEDITLPCEYVEPGQERCELTTWIHETVDRKEDIELINHGKVGISVAQRVNMTKECSVLLKDVKAKEAGRYTCMQYNSWGQDEPKKHLIYLSVISLNKVTNSLETKLNCSVYTYLRCNTVKVILLNEDALLTKTHPHQRVNKFSCWSSVHVPMSDISLAQQITCNVTHGDKKYQYRFKAEGQEESSITPLTTTELLKTINSKYTHFQETTQEEQSRLIDSNARADSEERTESGFKRWWWAVMAAAVVLLTAVLIFVTWKRVKGKPQEPNSAPPAEEGVSYASISFNKNHKKTAISANEETVIYSPVRSAASVDPVQLYASVNKRK